MSLRRVPRTLDERLAAMEEFVRSLQATSNESPTDTRYLYDLRGDILVAAGPDDPQRFGVPLTTPAGPGRHVLTSNPSRPLSVEWLFVDNLSGISGISGGSSGGGSGGGTSDHGALSGLADDDHPQYATDLALAAHAATSHGGGGSVSFASLSKWGR